MNPHENSGADPRAVRDPTDRSILLDRAYDEYCRRAGQGQAPDPDEFCQRFPEFKTSLYRLLEAHLFFQANPELLGELAAENWPEPGQTFLGFRLLRELGRGAFARVFLAAETALGDRLVALKVSRQGDAEAATLGPLEHPNVVPVNHAAVDPATGLTAICMPYRGSATLGDVIDRVRARGVPPGAGVIAETAGAAANSARGTYVDAVAAVAGQLADALAFVHSRGIFHRDLKPSNVLLGFDGRPLLLDFNLASAGPDPARRVGGTLPYMPPELLESGASEGPCGDLYALGVILYELLTGEHPFGLPPLELSAAEARSLLLERQRQGPRPLRDLNPAAGRRLARLVESCLAFDPKARPASAAELAAALRQFQSPRRYAGRRRWLAAAAVTGVLAIGLPVFDRSPAAPEPPAAARPVLTEQEIGFNAYRAGFYQDAVDHLTKAIMGGSSDPWVRYYRGRAHQHLGEFGPAVEDLNQASKRLPEAKVVAALGYSLCRQRQHGPAAECFRSALKAGLDAAPVHNDLGYALLSLGKYKEARDALEVALSRNPSLRAALHNRALIHLQVALNRPDAAREGIPDAEKALGVGPPSAALHYDAAALYALAGRGDDALKHLDAAVGLGRDPTGFDADIAFSDLKKDPRFVRILGRKPANQPPADPAPRLVDPVGD